MQRTVTSRPVVVDALYSFLTKMREETGHQPVSIELLGPSFDLLHHELSNLTLFNCEKSACGGMVVHMSGQPLLIRKSY